LLVNIGICLQDYTVPQGHVAQMEEIKNEHKVLIGKLEVKRLLGIYAVKRIILKYILISTMLLPS
jgi:hypothetical protein